MDSVAQIPQGKLRGRDLDDGVTAFMGIPYAAPPVGPLRWKPPQPPASWDGIRDATRAGARCIQHAPYGELEADNPNQSEDCLFLNVWTPNANPSTKLPVFFWIHGGEFWAGSGTEARYNGAKLAARGAVVVTINHRLGVFGFLAHTELSAEGERKTSGNYGLLDQIGALQWTRDNIAAFGGDPDNITVGGESAGSCSVSFLMASPLSKHLFHKAVGQSCAYFMPEPHGMKPLSHADNEQRGGEFLRAAGADNIAELRTMPAEHLLATWMKDTSKRMQPCFDDYVLPHVDQAFARGEQTRIPLLCGWNGDEYGFIRAQGDKFDAPAFLKRLETSFPKHVDEILAAYGAHRALETAAEITSDRLMVWPTWKWAEEHAKHAPVYVYQFDRAAPGSPFGATHASELEYVFGALDSKPQPWSQDDRDLSERIGDYWINFAKDGDPNGASLPAWPAYGADKQVVYLDAKDAVRPLKTRARLELLDRLFTK